MLLVCYGTRPEYIKVMSIVRHIEHVATLFTGQHTDLIGEHHPTFSIEIENMCGNRLNDIICSILKHNIFVGVDDVIVQGDTTSAMAIALSAFSYGVNVIHLEAGLRTHNIHDPYPEEMNRQLISKIATIHLCPTSMNKINLLSEGIASETIYVTGNTGLDGIDKSGITYGNSVIVTLHRRDNIPNILEWFHKIDDIAKKYTELTFTIPLHPNPLIQQHKHVLQ